MGEAFIFDCDGTIMDTIAAWHEAEERLLEESGITLSKEERDHLNSLTLDEAGEYFHSEFGLGDGPQTVRDMITDALLDYYRNDAEEKPGALDFVRALAERSIPLAVLSSSPHLFLDPGLARPGFDRLIDTVVSVDDLATTKRDPETYLGLCEQLGADPQRTWFFDDSWYALEAAAKAGLHCVGVFSADECGTHEELGRSAQKVIDDFTEERVEEYLES